MTWDKTKGLRWENRSLFLRTETSRLEETYTTSVLMICYNNTDQFFRLLDTIAKETWRDQFAITVVQNSDKQEALRTFEEKITSYTNITVLYPVHNLGSAGGYALWQEYLMHHWYEHLVMVEDDIEFLADDTISSMVHAAKMNEKHVVFINHPINAGGDHSRYVQLACYPLSLIRHAGIIDPRYFFRAEDLERAKRLEKHIALHHYHKTIVAKDYYHPYLKAMNNSGSWIYFSLRNQLWSFCTHHVGYLQIIRAIFFYLAFGLFVLLKARKKEIMLCVVQAMCDGIRWYRSFGYNMKIIEKFSRYKKLALHDIGFTLEDMKTLPTYIDTDTLLARTTLSVQDRELLGRYRWDLRISGWFQPVWGRYMIALQRLFIIEHLRLDKDLCSGKLLRQSFASSVINLWLFFPAALLWWIAIIVYTVLFLPISYLRK